MHSADVDLKLKNKITEILHALYMSNPGFQLDLMQVQCVGTLINNDKRLRVVSFTDMRMNHWKGNSHVGRIAFDSRAV